MRALLITLLVVIFLSLIAAALYAKRWWDDFTIKPDIQGLKSNLVNIASSLITNQTIPFTVLVDNNNKLGITIRNFQIKGYYEGKQVFQTQMKESLHIPASVSNYPINGVIQVIVNDKTFKLVNQILSNNNPTIQLQVIGTRFNLSRTFDYTITQ